jgi:hypothetical protein
MAQVNRGEVFMFIEIASVIFNHHARKHQRGEEGEG